MFLVVFEPGLEDSVLSSRMEYYFNLSLSGNTSLRKLLSVDAHVAV